LTQEKSGCLKKTFLWVIKSDLVCLVSHFLPSAENGKAQEVKNIIFLNYVVERISASRWLTIQYSKIYLLDNQTGNYNILRVIGSLL